MSLDQLVLDAQKIMMIMLYISAGSFAIACVIGFGGSMLEFVREVWK